MEGFVKGRGGVPLHYTDVGKGEPAIVCCNGFSVSTFFWRYLVDHFSKFHRVITWDYRGHGKSGSHSRLDAEDFSIRSLAEDLARVLEARKVKQAVLVGHSMGCQVILEYWNLNRGGVAALVPVCGTYGSPFDTFMKIPRTIGLPLFQYFRFLGTNAPFLLFGMSWSLKRPRLMYTAGRLGTILPPAARFEDMHRYFQHVASMDVRTFWTLAGEMQKHSAAGFLGKIDVPTLIVAGENDLFSPLQQSIEMHQRIDDSELLVLPKGGHTGLIEQPELLNLRLEKFLAQRVMPRPKARKRKPMAKARGGKR